MIGVTIKGGDASRKALVLLVNATREKVKAEMTRAAFSTKKTAQAIVPKATGKLGQGIDVATFFDTGSALRAIVTPFTTLYGQFVEGFDSGYVYGRRPGKAPPAAPILAWMLVRGIPPAALWPIRRKIAAQGTKAQPFMKPALDAEAARFDANMRRVIDDAAKGVQSIRGPLT